MQNSVGSFEAKTHFSQLIERAMHGEEILITRRGKPIAKIVPVSGTEDLEAAKAAGERLRLLAHEMNLTPSCWEEWKAFIYIGRR